MITDHNTTIKNINIELQINHFHACKYAKSVCCAGMEYRSMVY